MNALRPPLPASRRLELHRAVTLALLAGGVTGFSARAADAPAAEAEAKEAPATVDLKNWVELSAGGAIVNDNAAAFRSRYGLPDSAFGGVSSFHYEQEVATNTLFKVDGRGLFDNHDYNLKLGLTKEGLGYVRAGISEFRTYSDGSGGYVPATGTWTPVFDDELELDRRSFFFEAGLRNSKWPELTLRYERQERDGRKDATSWGEANTAVGPRKVVPAFWDLDEVRDLFSVDARKKLGKVDLSLGLSYEHDDFQNSRNLRNYPGEGIALDRYATQRENTDADLFNVHGSAATQINERLLFTVGYAYTDLDTGTTGYRVYGNGYDPDLANRLPAPDSFQDLSNDGHLTQHVANLNLMWSLARGLDLIPSLRVEQQDRDNQSLYRSPSLPASPLNFATSSDRGLLDVAEALELRYSGITNVVLYAKGDWLQGQGDLDETLDNLTTAANVLFRSSDDERTWQKYSLGASWYPARRWSLSAGYYHKIRDNEFDHTADSTPNVPGTFSRYPAYLVAQQFTVDDANVRLSWRPRNNLTLVARYDLQLGTIENQADLLASEQSAEFSSHIVSGSVSWVPCARVYLQARGSYVTDQTETPVSDLTTALQDAENDYWTLNATVGYAVSDDVDLDLTYFLYQADNYVDNSSVGLPYGAGTEEHGITASVTWRLNPRTRWLARYGYVTSEDESSGGFNDYDAHLLYTSVQYRF